MFQGLICDRKRKEKHFLLKLRAQRDSVFEIIKHKSAKKKTKHRSTHQAQKKKVQKGSIQTSNKGPTKRVKGTARLGLQ